MTGRIYLLNVLNERIFPKFKTQPLFGKQTLIFTKAYSIFVFSAVVLIENNTFNMSLAILLQLDIEYMRILCFS